MKRKIKIYPTKEETVNALAIHIKHLVHAKEKALVHIALSGGTTPALLFDSLAIADISWQRVHLWWSDERCVLPTDEQSNYGMTKLRLLNKISIPQENIHRIKGEMIPDDACSDYIQSLKDNFDTYTPKFDLILLGMGVDGHTASIFPKELHLFDSDAYCAVVQHPKTGQYRISFTGKLLNSAAEVCFLVAGIEKAEKIEEVLLERRNYKGMPSWYVQPSSGSLYFFLDTEAAKLL
ncbi:MAG: 6-phosphogluconolactonase [Mangrovibacterium sp.]